MNRRIALSITLFAVTLAREAPAQTPFGAGHEDEAPNAPEAAAPSPDVPPPPPVAPGPRKKPPVPVGLRADGGYALRTLVSLPVTGADMGLAMGAQPSRHAALWGASRLFLGSTANGLDVFSFRLGMEAEGIIADRLRLGAGLHGFVVGVDRAARDQTILSWGPAAAATARIDLIQSDGFAIFARAAIEGGYEIYNGTLFWGPTLGGGVDFDVAGQRSALK